MLTDTTERRTSILAAWREEIRDTARSRHARRSERVRARIDWPHNLINWQERLGLLQQTDAKEEEN